MRLFITGGLGTIGAMVTRHLVESGHEVTVFDIKETKPPLLRDLTDRFRLVVGDVSDSFALMDAMRSAHQDAVIHMAALLDVQGTSLPSKHIATNIIGFLNVLEACRLLKVRRLVFASSRAVYLEEKQGLVPTPISEDHPRIPRGDRGLYGPSKLFMEYLAEHYSRRYGLDCIGLRFSATFGPGKQASTHGHQSILSDMIEKSVDGLPVVIPSGGDQRNDFVYVRDIARAVALACEVDRVEHRIFNIGSGTTVSLREAADVIRKLLPEANITVGPGADYLGTGGYGYLALDITRARNELGYVPTFTLERAIEDYIQILRHLRETYVAFAAR